MYVLAIMKILQQIFETQVENHNSMLFDSNVKNYNIEELLRQDLITTKERALRNTKIMALAEEFISR